VPGPYLKPAVSGLSFTPIDLSRNLAGNGPMGFGPPRLCVQVKSSPSPADVNVLRGLQGVLQNFHAEQGLLVCWGGFKSSVIQEARQSFFTIRLRSCSTLLWEGERGGKKVAVWGGRGCASEGV
jgi:hypothetical protein